MSWQKELDFAVRVAESVSAYVLEEYHRFQPVPDAPASISTHVDHESQERIIRAIRAEFPNDGICAEENTPSLAGIAATSGRTWVVDPIDGTRGFAQKNGEFSVMIGLTVSGEPVLGVVAEPVIGRITYAAKGHGCWVRIGNGEAKRCVANATTNNMTLVVSHLKPGRPTPIIDKLKPSKILQTYSAGVKLAMVARGEADAYVNDYAGFHDWDICAGQMLVEEAGGRVTEFDGSRIQYGTKDTKKRIGVIACTNAFHTGIVNALK